jgi:hypothetical protein
VNSWEFGETGWCTSSVFTFYVKKPSRRSSTALYLPAPFAFVVLHFGPGAAGKQEPNYSLVPTVGSFDQRCCTIPMHVFTLLP